MADMTEAEYDRIEIAFAERGYLGLTRKQIKDFAEILAALTPSHSAEDAAVLDGLMVTHARICHLEELATRDDFEARDKYRAACLARMAGKVPTGYVLMPVKPTKDLLSIMEQRPSAVGPEDAWSELVAEVKRIKQ